MERITANHEYVIKYGFRLALGSITLIWLHQNVKNYKERQYLRNLVKERQTQRRKMFTNLQNQYKLTLEAKYIVDLSFEELQEELRTKKLSSVEVLSAFIAKALEADEAFNCVTEFNENAIEMATELDKLEHAKGPLHGIPFCVKDDTHVAGMDSTVGFAKNLNKPMKENSVIVQVLIDLGAIPFCRTNLPQSCISFGSHNPIFGKTLNPHNLKLSPGGSSSGTGALVGAGGAPFGIGTDTGGSARVPAHFCGLSTLKSSKNRVSRKGCLMCIDKCVGLVSTPCIIAKGPGQVSAIFQAMMETNLHNHYDAKAMPLPWNRTVFKSSDKLRIGFYTSLKVFPSLGDTADTVLLAKTALENLGHTLVPFELIESEKYTKMILKLSFADLGIHLAEKLKNDLVSPIIKPIYDIGCLPSWKLRLFSMLPSWMNYYNPNTIKYGLSVKESGKLWDTMSERHFIIEELLERMRSLKLDLILCPAWPFPALPVDDINNDTMVSGMYTFIWNLMDFPAGIVTIGKESGKHFNDDYEEGGDAMRKLARKNIRESVGMPIGVQIVGKPFQEELVLRTMVELEKQIHS